MKNKPEGCQCSDCVSCCTHKPGVFAFGEAEKAAKLLGLPFAEFRKRLIIDYWSDVEKGDIEYLTPRMVGVEEDQERASYGYGFVRGRCTFLTQEGRCEIHEAKPLECRQVYGCKDRDKTNWKKKAALSWRKVPASYFNLNEK